MKVSKIPSRVKTILALRQITGWNTATEDEIILLIASDLSQYSDQIELLSIECYMKAENIVRKFTCDLPKAYVESVKETNCNSVYITIK